MKYVRDFVIGSSFIVVAPFLAWTGYPHKKNTMQYSYYHYSLVTPIWFGVLNVLSSIMGKKFNLTKRERFFIISIISGLGVIIGARNFKFYIRNTNEWYTYSLYIMVNHLLVWNIVIYNLDKYV